MREFVVFYKKRRGDGRASRRISRCSRSGLFLEAAFQSLREPQPRARCPATFAACGAVRAGRSCTRESRDHRGGGLRGQPPRACPRRARRHRARARPRCRRGCRRCRASRAYARRPDARPNACRTRSSSGADVVYHCAAEIAREALMRAVNVEATRALLDARARHDRPLGAGEQPFGVRHARATA